MTFRSEDWSQTLDVLEARIARQETAVDAGQLGDAFEPVPLPTRTPVGVDRVRAQLALERIRHLEQELHRRKAAATGSRGRSSPYG